MNKRLSEQELRELETLYRATSCILEFLAQRGYFGPDVIAAGQSGLDDAYRRGELRALTMALRDYEALTTDLTEGERSELKAKLGSHLETVLSEFRMSDLQTIEIVLKRGMILTDDEYYILTSRLEEIGADPGKVKEAKRLDRLVTAYGTEL